MLERLGLNFHIVDVRVDLSCLKVVTVLQEVGNSPSKYVCGISVTSWSDAEYDQLESRVAELEWESFSEERIAELLKPDPTLQDLKTLKSGEISRACAAAILNGFESEALGQVYLYPCNDRDQANLSGTVLKALMSTDSVQVYPFLCRNPEGTWGYVDHTSSQIQQVGSDAYAAILAARTRNADLQLLIDSATSVEELEVIVW